MYLGCGLCMLRVQVFTSLLTLRMTSKTTHFPAAFYFESSLSPAVCVGEELGFMGLLNTFLSGRSCRDRVKTTTSKWSQLLFLPCPSPFPQNEALRSFTGLYQIFRGRCYTRRREPHGLTAPVARIPSSPASYFFKQINGSGKECSREQIDLMLSDLFFFFYTFLRYIFSVKTLLRWKVPFLIWFFLK